MIETDSYRIAVHTHDGPYENYLYLITDKATAKSVAIELSYFEQMAEESDGSISEVWLTHTHGDHINALQELRAAYPVPVHLSAFEAEFWKSTPEDATVFNDGDVLTIGETKATVLLTPGHTPGSCCFLLDEHLIAGDTLFTWGCGRCDLPGGDPVQMYASLAKLGEQVPHNIQVLPGHNYGDQMHVSMAEQILGNPFMQCASVEEFTEYRMKLHDKIRSTPYHAVSKTTD